MLPNSHEIKEANVKVSLLSEYLIKYYGCLSTVAEVLEINRGTVRKYAKGKEDLLLIWVKNKWVPFAPVTRRGEHSKVNIPELINDNLKS